LSKSGNHKLLRNMNNLKIRKNKDFVHNHILAKHKNHKIT
jgi:hypothetical protein